MVSRKGAYSLICLCLIWVSCQAIEYEPWIGNYLEFEWRDSLLYQNYPVIARGARLDDYSSDDFFITNSLSFTADPNFSIELELTAAKTRVQSWGVDNFRIAGRYVWLDDIAGDPLSLTTGFVLTQCFVSSLKDISSFHHGRAEGEVFLSVGKEMAKGENWVSRWWTVFGLGAAADRGSAWVRGNIGYDMHLCANHQLRFLTNSLWGFGRRELHPHHFNGYGLVQHQSIDMGFRYTYLIDYVGSLNFEYAYRVYARNFPAQTQRLMLTFLYTFGL